MPAGRRWCRAAAPVAQLQLLQKAVDGSSRSHGGLTRWVRFCGTVPHGSLLAGSKPKVAVRVRHQVDGNYAGAIQLHTAHANG